MARFRNVPAPWLAVAAVAGAAIGAAAVMRARPPAACPAPSAADGAAKRGCCHGPGDAQAVKCPVHWGTDDVVVDDRAAAEKLRHALVDGIFALWTETGRAPTP